MLAKFIVRAIFAAIGLWLSSMLVAGVAFTDMGSLILAAVLLGVVNAILRPILFVVTLPLTILTLGLFLLVVNAFMLWLTAKITELTDYGLRVDGFWPALWGGVIISLVNWVLGILVPDGDD